MNVVIAIVVMLVLLAMIAVYLSSLLPKPEQEIEVVFKNVRMSHRIEVTFREEC